MALVAAQFGVPLPGSVFPGLAEQPCHTVLYF